MKKTALLLLALISAITLTFSSCSGSSDTAADIPVADLTAAADGHIANAAKLSAVDDDYIKGSLEVDPAMLSEYILKIQVSGTEIDQYGIFKVADENNVQAVADSLNAYLDMMRANWEALPYQPQEKPKLDSAGVEIIGNYVLFTILSAEESDAVVNAVNDMLKSK